MVFAESTTDVARLIVPGLTSAVVISAHDAEAERAAVSVVEDIAATHPDVAIIAYCDAGIAHSSRIRALAIAGAHEFLFRDIDDAGVALRSVVNAGDRECSSDRVLGVLRPLLPPTMAGFAEVVVTRPGEAQTVAAVARLLGVHRKTLVNHCLRSHLPPPVELLGWCRLMLAAHVLHRRRGTVEATALELEWASVTSLRNMMKRYTGLSPTDVRNRGGLSWMATALRRRLVAVAGSSQPQRASYDIPRLHAAPHT